MGAMYLFRLDYFFDNDMLFLSSLCDIIVPVFFGYGFVLFEYIRAIERMAKQERLALIGLMDAQLTHDIHSPIVVIGNLKEAFEKVKITEDELRTYWKAIDPVNYIHKMKETQLLQLNTIQDTVFPLSCQKKLSLAFKKSNVKYQLSLFPFPCGHYSAGKYLLPKLYLLAKVFFFAKRHL
jgi:hypothetical protein